MRKGYLNLLFFTLLFYGIQSVAQKTFQANDYVFTITLENKATGIKDQALSSTCWSFSTLAMLESELIRQGKGTYDLSEMYVVYYTYFEKSQKYIRMHGHNGYSGGGALDDPMNIIRKYGIVPESAYLGRKYDFQLHNHQKMDQELKDYMDKVVDNEIFTKENWNDSIKAILEKYMGIIPHKFIFNNHNYTVADFTKKLDIQYADYVLLGSYNHHPYYSKFILEVPDNWSWGEIYNVRVDEMIKIIDNALKKGYTVSWATDVSEDFFSWEYGIAVVPASTDIATADIFKQPVEELKITQEIRQDAFDSYNTTDDHGMQIVGLASDQNGKEYYLVKNSWGTLGNRFNGYIFVSKAYVEYKTTSFYLNKNGIPGEIRNKLGI
ncbi:MAG: aminopeptidase [Bacteroidales bacterium]|nr:aminopeptidase [Bacteroidales bacterium]